MKKLYTLLILFFALVPFFATAQFRIIGYMPSWTMGSFGNVNLSQLTHVNAAFGNPDAAGNIIFDGSISTIVNAAHAKNVKVFISLGGANINAAVWQSLLSAGNRANFISKVTNYVVSNGLDGADVDLEGDALTYAGYNEFCQGLAQSLHANGKQITAAVATWTGGNITAETLSAFDWINAMSYDATGTWAPNNPGQHSPISLMQSDYNYWKSRGLPNSKIVVGVPFYGYQFVNGTCTAFTYAQITNSYAGAENVDVINGNLYYNGIPTIQQKTEYAYNNAGGIMAWELSQDAFNSKSLLNAIYNKYVALKGNVVDDKGVSGLNGTYSLQNRNSGLYMDVANNGDPADGTNILQWTGTGGTNQQFIFTDLGNGIYKIICVKTGKAVDIDGVSSANFANVHQWSYVGGANQQFIVKATDNGYYKLIAKHSHKLIEVGSAGKNAGDNINQYDDNNQLCGQWKLVPVGNSSTKKIEAESYNNMSGVQVEACNEGGSNVGYIDANDWMAYNSVNFPTTGTYTFEFRVASVSGATLSADLNAGTIQLGSAIIPATGGWQNWQTVKFSTTVNAGTYNLGVFAKTGGWNINWIQITSGLKSTQLDEAIQSNQSASISISPNPVNSFFSINGISNAEIANITILDLNGVTVLKSTISSQEKIDVASLKAGFYLVKITTETKSQTVRLIKR